ncbi:MAG TPA: multiheme c-type cytochrome, partial [Thermoanaerobaculia bacterium]|nr:multiheme c-type cytochrome [Thermoanaerobaculia bacterium]
MRALALAALLGGALAAPAAAASTAMDATQTVGPETCARCHDREYEVWQGTKHAKLFTTEPLHLRPRAQEIGKKLGVRLIKSDSLCLNCHFTPKVLSGRVIARAGVSCESCHGAAQGW